MEQNSVTSLGNLADIRGGLALYPRTIRGRIRTISVEEQVHAIQVRDIGEDDIAHTENLKSIDTWQIRRAFRRSFLIERSKREISTSPASITMRNATGKNVYEDAKTGMSHLKDTLEKHRVQEGDLFIRSRGNNHRSALLQANPPKRAVFILPLLRIRILFPKLLLPSYLHWFLNSPEGQKEILRLSEGTVLRQITKINLATLLIPIPPFPVQEKIAVLNQLLTREKQKMVELFDKNARRVQSKLKDMAFADYPDNNKKTQ